MPSVETKISELLDSSREVLLDCALDNGAIVAANTDHPRYPKNASNYRYVWPRDAAFMLYALNLLDIPRAKEFSKWLLERAESFHQVGLLFRRYATNGACSWPDDEFQPDQAGAMLWSLAKSGNTSSEVKEAAAKIADGLCRTWNNDHFSVPTHDLWEHIRLPETNGSLSYSLAACSHGLKLAAHQFSNANSNNWLEISEQMSHALENAENTDFYSRVNKFEDGNIDGSLSALAWPFAARNSKKIHITLDKIKSELMTENGVLRYSGDTYDGLVLRSLDLEQGGGAWPILTFWYAIARHEAGDKVQAREVFGTLIKQLDSNYIPEQLFRDDRLGITPLGWSHAMFVIAAHRLGYL